MKWSDSAIEVIHPYLGFVRDPERTPNTSYLGFAEKNDDPFLGKDSNAVTVAVFGGSFAIGTSTSGESVIQSTLQDDGIDLPPRVVPPFKLELESFEVQPIPATS